MNGRMQLQNFSFTSLAKILLHGSHPYKIKYVVVSECNVLSYVISRTTWKPFENNDENIHSLNDT